MNDNVNHPSHYTSGKYECIYFIEDRHLGFHLGNVVKYITRAGKKDKDKSIEDLNKAKWYIIRFKEWSKAYGPIRVNMDRTNIDVYDYARDQNLSSNLTMALIEVVDNCDLNSALVHLDAEIEILKGSI